MAGKKFREPRQTEKPEVRDHLNADALLDLIRADFNEICDHRDEKATISLADTLMSGFAVFSLKAPSLLAFEKAWKGNKIRFEKAYGIETVPSDSRMREILDPVDPESLRGPFQKILAKVQQEKALAQFAFLDDHYLISGDGTGFFYSEKLSNGKCLTKTSKTKGTAYHQAFYGVALVHPDFREVIPLPPEFITKQDGETKNDCEREAAKRCLAKIRQEHPDMKLIMVEDALASNAPHIRELQAHNIRFILGAKETDHRHLFQMAAEAEDSGHATNFYMDDPIKPRVRHNFFFVNGLPLNKANPGLKVNFLEHWEITLDKNGKEIRSKQKHFSWVTDLEITKDNVFEIMRGGRARWESQDTHNMTAHWK